MPTATVRIPEKEIICLCHTISRKCLLKHAKGGYSYTINQKIGWLVTVLPERLQWFAQVLLGAVNHEQSKTIAFSSVKFLVGPSVRAIGATKGIYGYYPSELPKYSLLPYGDLSAII